MKHFIDKFSSHTSRFEPFLLIIPFLFWIFCFRYFFTGQLWLQADSISYADHLNYYTDCLSKGVFPLWDPDWFGGAPYHFFLRRIGDVNPLLFLIILLKGIGVSPASAFLIFIGTYYFLAGWAFYLITRFLLVDRFFAFSAYILFLFSSWGSEIFYNYIIIIFVPIIWFFYFLLSFSRTAKKGYFLGMCLCIGVIVTTYIPFFFLTILAIFFFLYILFYWKEFLRFLIHARTFLLKNKIFTVFCIIFLLASCIPGYLFYKESKTGEFVLPNRHSGADTSSAVAVGIQNVASGDIISHGYFDRIFDDHTNIDMGDIYLPYIFFLILLTSACGRVNKLIFFLLFNILGLSLITITSAAGVHHFLYEHIIIFKFIRNIYYFFWLGMLPMGILISISAFKSLLSAVDNSPRKMAWAVYIILCHLAFFLFLFTRQGVLWGAWVAVFISLLYFLIYFRYGKRISYLAGFCLFLLAVFVQSLQVYQSLDNKLFKFQENISYKPMIFSRHKSVSKDIYYASSWFSVLVNYIDPKVFDVYINHPFIFYDNVVPYKDSQEFFKTLQASMSANTNIAYLSGFDSMPADWKNTPGSPLQADIDPVASGKLSVLSSDSNTWVLKTHLPQSEFLVINDNYNKGWNAFIDGHRARLLRANVSFKGLWVPAGDSTIVLRFLTPLRYLFHYFMILFFAAVFIYMIILLNGPKKPKN